MNPRLYSRDIETRRELESIMRKNRKLCGLPASWNHSTLLREIAKLQAQGVR